MMISHVPLYMCVNVYVFPERARGIRKTNWIPSIAQEIDHKAQVTCWEVGFVIHGTSVCKYKLSSKKHSDDVVSST